MSNRRLKNIFVPDRVRQGSHVLLSPRRCAVGKSSNYTGCYFAHDVARIFYTEQKHKEVDPTHACFGINLVEVISAGAFP